jgi:hypothetical protein
MAWSPRVVLGETIAQPGSLNTLIACASSLFGGTLQAAF